MDRIVILGLSGHARVVADALEQEGKCRIVGLVGEGATVGEHVMGYEVLGRDEDLPELASRSGFTSGIIAIGDNARRSGVEGRIRSIYPEIQFATVVHPGAWVGRDVTIGPGTVVMAGAVINPGSSVGAHCIINTRASLDHDSIMGDYSSLAPGVVTGGNVRIGPFSAIGLGASIVHGISVGEHSVVGAGSTVVDDIPEYCVAYGSPAAVVRPRKAGERYL